MAELMLQFAQFMHPGKEHRPGPNGSKLWNKTNGSHRRTFVSQVGRYLTVPGKRTAKESELHFWCEWECEADLIHSFPDRRASGRPRFMFKPTIHRRITYARVHNTDPFVFGECFRYCICRQGKIERLRRLQRGSLILFGSHVGKEFVLDTVFVVARGEDYDESNYGRLRVPNVYRDASLEPIFANKKCAGTRQGRLYDGATFDEKVDGMYSFFPCLPADESRKSGGFQRPRIRIKEYVNPRLMMGAKIHQLSSTAEARCLWQNVVDQVQKQKLCLGVSAQLPIYVES